MSYKIQKTHLLSAKNVSALETTPVLLLTVHLPAYVTARPCVAIRVYAPACASMRCNAVVLKDAWARIEVHGRELRHMGAHSATWTHTDSTHGLID